MMNDDITVDSEGKGKYGLSIGTELALMSYLGLDPDMAGYKEKYPAKGARLWVCIRTMFRNIYSSLPTITKDKYTVDLFVDRLQNEMLLIESMIVAQGKNAKITFYYNTRDSLLKQLPLALLKESTTAKQKFQETMEVLAMKRIRALFYKSQSFLLVDSVLQVVDDINVLLTSFPTDLILCTRVKLIEKVLLLESHTGNIKDRNNWYTKLPDKDKLSRIPVTKMSISFFGDNKLLKPYGAILRKEMIEIATKQNWNQLTSPRIVDKVISEFIAKQSKK